MSNEKPTTTERFAKILGYDPSKKPGVTGEVLSSVLEELKAKRADEAKERAREIIKQALTIQEELVKAEKSFKDAKEKFEKQLGQLLNRLEGGSQAAPESEANQGNQ